MLPIAIDPRGAGKQGRQQTVDVDGNTPRNVILATGSYPTRSPAWRLTMKLDRLRVRRVWKSFSFGADATHVQGLHGCSRWRTRRRSAKRTASRLPSKGIPEGRGPPGVARPHANHF
ncbi:hypothetical protein DHEL01_v204365 [Diaporthe helianthi]|uniref:Uncharacterized protein n=1 Tax=Diaporthe helianthi TaxID=158607 RepID=A0A2P5I436_DIAHE|nr:hypothetical protein DHEL01_v204365 [Diaporthe helianthi]